MIETDCVRELNVFGTDDCPAPDLILNAPIIEEKPGCFPFRRKVNFNIKYEIDIILNYLFVYTEKAASKNKAHSCSGTFIDI
jgi:hypothetical protein